MLLKVLAWIGLLGCPWFFGHIAWQELFERENTRLEYWKVLAAGPEYLVQSCLLAELACLALLFGNRMEHRLRLVLGAIGASCVLLFALFFIWPTLWIYSVEYREGKPHRLYPMQIRVNRFTGEKQFLSGDWVDNDPSSSEKTPGLS